MGILLTRRVNHKIDIIIQDTYLDDGYLDAFMERIVLENLTLSNIVIVSNNDNNSDLHMKLLHLDPRSTLLVVVHCETRLMMKIIRKASDLGIFDLGHAWLLTELALGQLSSSKYKSLPVGLLILQNVETISFQSVIRSGLEAYRETLETYLSDEKSKPLLMASKSTCFIQRNTGRKSFIQFWKSYISGKSFSDGNGSLLSFDKNHIRIQTLYRLLNLASVGDRYLNRVGTIRNNNVELDTIVWPGNTIVGPMFKERNTYMIVTKVAPPFVVRQAPYTDDGRCFSKHPCLQVHTSDNQVLKQIMLNYQSDGENSALNYTKYCCSGLSVDLMEKLAADLDFNFIMFFASDNEYGTLGNGSWSGMMGYMVDGAVEMMIGSFGITDSKLRYVDFTEPYYYSGFSMVSVAIERNTTMTAFLEPFSNTVWLCIFLFATVTAIATSLFEWNSPFGLNPWGRKRKKNYTLGSGINMVYSVLFGHTISTKPPKCWPSKVLQNFWAGLAIFIVASYTANLAAFLAGRSQTVILHSIFDTKMMRMKVGSVKGSPVDHFVNKIYPELHYKMRSHYVRDVKDAITELGKGTLDVYLDDTDVIEYAIATEDSNCSLKYVGKSFGGEGYAIGLPRKSWLKAPLNERLLAYYPEGYFDDLRKKHFAKLKCLQKGIAYQDIKYGIEHTAGLFVMMVATVGFSGFLMWVEHMVFKYVIPTIRQKPNSSLWKGYYCMFISQRIHRIITSQVLVSPQYLAKEMVSIVRNREFTRLFQKESNRNRVTQKEPLAIKTQDVAKDVQGSKLFRVASIIVDSHQSDSSVDVEGVNQEVYLQCTPPVVTLHRDLDTDSNEPPICYREINVTKTFPSDINAKDPAKSSPNPSRQTDVSGLVSTDSPLTGNRKSVGLENAGFSKPDGATVSLAPGMLEYLNNGSVKDDIPVSNLDDSNVWTISEGHMKINKDINKDQNNGNMSVEELTASSGRENNNLQSDSTNPQCLKTCLTIKDNRVKSTLRRHAARRMCSRIPAALMDQSTLDSLSKEDLLLMWKASEIEINKKLDEVFKQTDRLKQTLEDYSMADT